MTFRYNPYRLIVAVVLGTPLLFSTTYLITAYYGHHDVKWCIPPIHGCVTISYTGIDIPESYVYRFGAYPLMTFMALLFYFFKEWIEGIIGQPSRRARIAWNLALVGCICMGGAIAVMQQPFEPVEYIHSALAITYFILMLVSQSLYTYEDYRYLEVGSKTALTIRLVTIFLQASLLVSAPLLWIFGDIAPNTSKEWLARYEWLGVITFFLWYSSFLFERKTVFIDHGRQLKHQTQLAEYATTI